jgi:ribonuclease Z
MPELLVLGTAASVPDADHDTVGLALRGRDWAVLVDCGGSPLYKLAGIGVNLDHIRAVVLTHRHADHIYGLPMLVQGLWLSGREVSLPIYGPAEALTVGRQLLELFDLAERPDMFDLQWTPVPLRENRKVLAVEGVEIRSTPVDHRAVETLALRFRNLDSGRTIVYSADSEPCQTLVRLASGADLLIHEATGAQKGHSSPGQAARVAREAGVAQLVLIHYPVLGVDLDAWRAAASEFGESVALARDGDIFPL